MPPASRCPERPEIQCIGQTATMGLSSVRVAQCHICAVSSLFTGSRQAPSVQSTQCFYPFRRPTIGNQPALKSSMATYKAVFPAWRRRRVYTTNPLERVMRNIKRRTRVVGVFPNEASCDRPVGAHLIETHESWQCEKSRYLTIDAPVANGQYGDENISIACRRTIPLPRGRDSEVLPQKS